MNVRGVHDERAGQFNVVVARLSRKRFLIGGHCRQHKQEHDSGYFHNMAFTRVINSGSIQFWLLMTFSRTLPVESMI